MRRTGWIFTIFFLCQLLTVSGVQGGEAVSISRSPDGVGFDLIYDDQSGENPDAGTAGGAASDEPDALLTMADALEGITSLARQYDEQDRYSEAALEAVCAWLAEQDFVAMAEAYDSCVLFVTEDGLVGSYGLDQRETGYLGGYTSLDEIEIDPGFSEDVVRSEMTMTNPNCLMISPIYTEEDRQIQKAAAAALSEFADFTGGEFVSVTGKVPGELSILERDNLNFTDYGLIYILSHGGRIPINRATGEVIGVFLMDYLTREEFPAFRERNDLVSGMSLSGSWGEVSDAVREAPYIFNSCQDGELFEIYGTSVYLEELLGERMFDNSIVLFAACNSLMEPSIANTFRDHGAAAYIGTAGLFNEGYSVCLLKELTAFLAANSGKTAEEYTGLKDFDLSLSDYGLFEDAAFWYLAARHDEYSYEDIVKNKNKKLFEGTEVSFFGIEYSPGIAPATAASNIWDAQEAKIELRLFHQPGVSMSGGSTLRGGVVNEKEEPVEGAEVTLYHWLDHQLTEAGTTVSDADGQYHFDSIPYGMYVTAAKKGFLTGKITGEFTHTAVLGGLYENIVLAGAGITGKVVLAQDHSPLTGISVQYMRNGTTSGVLTDEEGVFVAGELEAGDYTVKVSYHGLEFAVFENVGTEIGEVTDLGTIELRFYDLYGRVTDAESGEGISGADVTFVLEDMGGIKWQATADENGGFAIEDVPGGALRVTASHKNYRPGETVGLVLDSADVTVLLNDLELEKREIPEGYGRIGNDPNNLYQSEYCLAFDEEHVYYSDDGVLMRANLDGSEALRLGTGSGFLNVCDNYLYYANSSYEKAWIRRINLDTFEEESVFEYEGNKWDSPEFTSMLVVDDCVFFGLQDSQHSANYASAPFTKAYMVELENFSCRQLFSSSDSGYLNIKFSVSPTDVYAFIKEDGGNSNERRVYRMSRADLPDGGSLTQVTQTVDFGPYNSVVFFPDRLYRFGSSSLLTQDMYYYQAPYEKIDEEEMAWRYKSDTSAISLDLVELPEAEAAVIYSKNPRFVLGSSMFILSISVDENSAADVYRYGDMDFTKGEVVASVNVDPVFFNGEYAAYGIHDDVLYLAAVDEDGGRSIISIREDGTVGGGDVVLSEQQSDNVSVYMGKSENESFEYSIYTNHIELTQWVGEIGDVVEIPGEIDGLPVTVLKKSLFREKPVGRVILPDSLREIGDYVFCECHSLTEINLPRNLTRIGQYAFYETAITTLAIPEGVTEIPEGMCDSCGSLTRVALPPGLKSIGKKAFNECEHLTSVTLPEGLEMLGEYAFNRCYELRELVIPESVTTLGKAALSETAITGLKIPDGIYTVPEAFVSECRELRDVTLGTSVRSIESRAFEMCDALTEIFIPENVGSIKKDSFSGSGLKRVKGKAGTAAQSLAEYYGIEFAGVS